MLLVVLIFSFLVEGLYFAGLLPFWLAGPSVLATLATYLAWDKKTDRTDATWGEGARGEARVGAELERLQERGFHVFHDWDSGRGNVDHFLVGPHGIFAVETKAWSGKITCEGENLAKDGWALRGKDDPLGQARGNAWKIHGLVEGASGVKAWVVPVLCFTKAEVACYGKVGGVEVTTVGSVNAALADPERASGYRGGRWERYSPQEVRAISGLLEKRLGTGPAAAPGLPPEEPTRTKKLLDRFFALPNSTLLLGFLGAALVGSLLLPGRASKIFLDISYLYHLMGEAWGRLLWS